MPDVVIDVGRKVVANPPVVVEESATVPVNPLKASYGYG